MAGHRSDSKIEWLFGYGYTISGRSQHAAAADWRSSRNLLTARATTRGVSKTLGYRTLAISGANVGRRREQLGQEQAARQTTMRAAAAVDSSRL